MRSHAKAPHGRRRNARKAVASAFLLALALLVMTSAPASAVVGHSLLRTFSTGPGTNPRSVATDSAGNVYVLEVGAQRIDKLDSAGNRLPFSGSAGYISDTALTGTSDGPFEINLSSNPQSAIAVDRSGGPNDGYIYFARTDPSYGVDLFVFDPTGTYKGQLGPHSTYNTGVGVNQATGEVYVAAGAVIRRYPTPTGNPDSYEANGQLNAPLLSGALAVDSSGAVYLGDTSVFGPAPVKKFDSSQFGLPSPTPAAEYEPLGIPAVDPVNGDLYIDSGNLLIKRSAAGVQQGAPFGNLNNSQGATVDRDGNVLASDGNGGVFVYGPNQVELPLATTGASANVGVKSAEVDGSADPDLAGTITGCEFRYGPDSGYSEGSVPCTPGGPITSTAAVSANLTGLVSGTTYHYRLFLTNANGTQAGNDQTFTTPVAIEGLNTAPATEVRKDSADLNGSFTGDGQDTHYFFEWGRTSAYGHTAPANDAGSGTGPQSVAPVHIGDLKAATTYHFRIVASNAGGIARGQDEAFTTASAVTNLTADPVTGITNHGAELHASFDADSYETHYYFEWGPTTNYGNTAPAPPGDAVAPGSGRVSVPSVPITGLAEGATYHLRVVASNATGTTVSPDISFKTAEAPSVGNLSTSKVTAISAELSGEVNPHSAPTTYHFEWGPTTAYGNSIPVSDAAVGSGLSPVPVTAQLEGLSAGVTYHFRLVATNQYGTVRSVDQSFGFYPPACPNSQVRQETRSNNLPDCRAYELVTPGFAQGALIMPLDGPNTGLATNPSRLAYGATFGLFPEDTGEPLNNRGDLYVSTRSSGGWFQKYIGRPGSETQEMGSPPVNGTGSQAFLVIASRNQFGTQVSPQMDKIIDYDRGWPGGKGQLGEPSNAPYVWESSTGKLLERWPSNLPQIAGGTHFVGVPQASADFSHFVFSSNVVFAPGGEYSEQKIVCVKCAAPPGPAMYPYAEQFPALPKASVYDNDLTTGSVVLASRSKDDTPFQGYVYNVSDDGSHILMGGEAPVIYKDPYKPPLTSHAPAEVVGPLYLRIDAERTVEIAPGRHIHYVGSTADGDTVYLTSAEQLSADDQDSSNDLYAWHQSAPEKMTLVSVGVGGTGNSDACSAAWIGGCGIGIIQFDTYAATPAGDGGNGAADNFIASESGDIYFESPEQLVVGKGEPNQVNLYLYREGTVRYVTTMSPGSRCTEVNFEPVCSDGPVARMQVTPDGDHMAMVTASNLTAYDSALKREMYTFDPNSGRVTCASCRPDGQPPVSDVHASQNGLFQTYDGRVFFSTADALAPRDTNQGVDVYEYTEGKATLISSGIGASDQPVTGLEPPNSPGLVSVSANGTDVYFGTRDVLVTQDQNGQEFKIYDARTGGGFPAERVESKCTAADECHGPGAAQPALPPDRTSAGLGKPVKPKAHRKSHKHKKHKKKRSGKARKASKSKQGRTHRG